MTTPTRRTIRWTLYGSVVISFLSVLWLYNQVRTNNLRDAISVRDRQGLHRENQWSQQDRANLHTEAADLKTAVQAFVRESRAQHDQTQVLLRQVRDQLDRIERTLASRPGGGHAPAP
jgi:uncharacterized protein YlxW (UPF0749 family)